MVADIMYIPTFYFISVQTSLNAVDL